MLPYIVKRGRRLKMAHEEAPKKRMKSLEKVKGKTQNKCRKSIEKVQKEARKRIAAFYACFPFPGLFLFIEDDYRKVKCLVDFG